MELVLDFNNSLSELNFPVTVDETEFLVTGHTILGFCLVILAAYLQRLAVTRYKNWKLATAVIGPSLLPLPPAINIAIAGCVGLVFYWFALPMVIILLIAGADQMIWQGGMLISFGQMFVS